MRAQRQPIERLDLTFRAEPPPGAQRLALPGGWGLWCLLGLAIGVACWLAGRQHLVESLATQLTHSRTTAEAMLAVEGLLMLDADAASEIVRGLEHQDLAIARTAYRTLDSQITAWQKLEPTVAMARLQKLAARLQQLPPSTPSDNLVLASGLASRIFSDCLEKDDAQLRPLMATCEAILQRAGTVRVDLASNTERLDANLALSPPPRLANPAAGPPQTPLAVGQAPGAADSETGEPSKTDNTTAGAGAVDAAPAGTGATSGEVPPSPAMGRSAEVGSRGAVAADEVDANSSRAPQAIWPTATMRLTSARSDGAEAEESLEARPLMVASPASLSSVPLVRMKIVSEQPDLEGVQDLEIEELVRLLASTRTRVAQAAALALRSKGMNDERLALATELASGSAARRLELVQHIAVDRTLEPRPWLLWMAEDGEPEVRKLAVSLLSSMLDANVERSLRILLARERDMSVERAIRQTLIAGSQRAR